jgi:hypothetical protein
MIWKNCEAVFTDYGGFRGRSLLGEGGSGKAAGFVAGGKAFPLFLFLRYPRGFFSSGALSTSIWRVFSMLEV